MFYSQAMSDMLLSYVLCFPNLILFKLIPSFPIYYIHHRSSILNSVIPSSPLPAVIILAFLFLCIFTYLSCVVISFSRGSSQPRDRTQVSHIAGRFLEPPGKPPCVYN